MPPHLINRVYTADWKKERIDSLVTGSNEKGNRSLSNNWGRLSQGNLPGVKVTETIGFIHLRQVQKE